MEQCIVRMLNMVGILAFLLAVLLGMMHGVSPPNKCNMSFMYPGYEEIPLLPGPANASLVSLLARGKYRLLRYMDGRRRLQGRELRGPPVVFVPGHDGCYKQVRRVCMSAQKSLGVPFC
jgi:hypothetical protein